MGASARSGMRYWGVLVFALVAVLLSACGGSDSGAGSLTVYSGRSDTLVAPLIKQFAESTGIDVRVKYASTPQLAATLLEEGGNTPADIFFAQDPGGLGAVSALLAPLSEGVLQRVPQWAVSPSGVWVGVSGRARTVVYNTENLTPADLPKDLTGFPDATATGRTAGAPPGRRGPTEAGGRAHRRPGPCRLRGRGPSGHLSRRGGTSPARRLRRDPLRHGRPTRHR